MVNKVWLNVKEIKSIFTTIEEFAVQYIKRFSSPELKSNLINQNRKGCGAKTVQVVSKRKLRIIHSVQSDENSAN